MWSGLKRHIWGCQCQVWTGWFIQVQRIQRLFSVSYVQSHLYLEPHPLIGSLRMDANTCSKQALCLQSSQQRQRMNGWADRWMGEANRMRSAVWASYIRLADHLVCCENSKELLSMSHGQVCFISVLGDKVVVWFLKTFQPVLTASQGFQDSNRVYTKLVKLYRSF